MFTHKLLLCWLLVASMSSVAQRQTTCGQVQIAKELDGWPTPDEWADATHHNGLVQVTPQNGQAAQTRTDLWLAADANNLYVAARMVAAPAQALGARDAGTTLQSNWFSVEMNPFGDAQRAFGFMVSESGVQSDVLYGIDTEDANWNAVWYSATARHDSVWAVEMRIPLTALRFPKQSVGRWQINFRVFSLQRNELAAWNPIDISTQGLCNQMGILSPVPDFATPLRLAISPYLTGNWLPQQDTPFQLTKGLDLKWGIRNGFTLDMMMVPDFSQAAQDEILLNLTPIEQRLSENRQFFTENADIFDRGKIFYSRRIGGPLLTADQFRSDMQPTDSLAYLPEKQNLWNATKLSGRSASGFGLGLLNALGARSVAEVVDTRSGQQRHQTVQGMANYNMLVADWVLPHQSFVAVANTNVLIPENGFVANTTALAAQHGFGGESHRVYGRVAFSANAREHQWANTFYGGLAELGLARVRGRWQWRSENTLVQKTYNPNAMGYLDLANLATNRSTLSYEDYRPGKYLLERRISLQSTLNFKLEPWRYGLWEWYLRTEWKFLNNHLVYTDLSVTPISKYDHFEPRLDALRYREPVAAYGGVGYRTDPRRPLALTLYGGYWRAAEWNKSSAYFNPRLNWLWGSRFKGYYEFYYENNLNSIGWVANTDTEAFFGRRNVHILAHTLQAELALSENAGLQTRVRHYWSQLDYNRFFELDPNGELRSPTPYVAQHDWCWINLQASAQLYWQFAPGSNLSFNYQLQSNTQGSSLPSYDKAFEPSGTKTLHRFSLRVLYYIDLGPTWKRFAPRHTKG